MNNFKIGQTVKLIRNDRYGYSRNDVNLDEIYIITNLNDETCFLKNRNGKIIISRSGLWWHFRLEDIIHFPLFTKEQCLTFINQLEASL